MRSGLFAKLFLALLGAVGAVALVMAIAVQWSFRHGFMDYLLQVDIERLSPLRQKLEASYETQGGWAWLRDNPHAWHRLLDEALPQENFGRPPGPRDRDDHRRRPPPWMGIDEGPRFRPDSPLPPPFPDPFPRESAPGLPQPDAVPTGGEGVRPPFFDPSHPPSPPDDPAPMGPPPPEEALAAIPLAPRLRLLDGSHQPVVGHSHGDEGERLLPLHRDGEIVGWLALAPTPIIGDRLAASFEAQQGYTNGLIFLFALALAALAALLLARQLLAPVRRLADGARSLTEGRYDTRIETQSRDELGALAADFNTLAQTLERNEQVRRQWIADISHELRNPLGILRGEIEALLDGVRQPTPERLRSLHHEVLALGKLVDDLYELALSDLGALDYRKEPLDLLPLLAAALDAVQPRFVERGLALESHVTGTGSGKPILLLADYRRLGQLFANLLENSLRYTHPGGRLEIRIKRTERFVRIHFCDTAPGVPDESLGRLFERLYRVDKSRSRELGGAGLGLAICKNIVEAHGGVIQARHSPLGGLWLAVTLPLLEPK